MLRSRYTLLAVHVYLLRSLYLAFLSNICINRDLGGPFDRARPRPLVEKYRCTGWRSCQPVPLFSLVNVDLAGRCHSKLERPAVRAGGPALSIGLSSHVMSFEKAYIAELEHRLA